MEIGFHTESTLLGRKMFWRGYKLVKKIAQGNLSVLSIQQPFPTSPLMLVEGGDTASLPGQVLKEADAMRTKGNKAEAPVIYTGWSGRCRKCQLLACML